MKFGDWLGEEISGRGLTISEFGERVGVSHATVSRWISGKRHPDQRSVTRIAQVLGLSPTLVLEMTGHREVREEGTDALVRELEQLRAERESRKHRRRQEIKEFDKRISELEQQLARKGVQAWSLWGYDELPGYLQNAPKSAGNFLHELDPIEELSWHIRSYFGTSDPIVEELLDQYRHEWTDGERRAFASGLLLGLQAAKTLAPPDTVKE